MVPGSKRRFGAISNGGGAPKPSKRKGGTLAPFPSPNTLHRSAGAAERGSPAPKRHCLFGGGNAGGADAGADAPASSSGGWGAGVWGIGGWHFGAVAGGQLPMFSPRGLLSSLVRSAGEVAVTTPSAGGDTDEQRECTAKASVPAPTLPIRRSSPRPAAAAHSALFSAKKRPAHARTKTGPEDSPRPSAAPRRVSWSPCAKSPNPSRVRLHVTARKLSSAQLGEAAVSAAPSLHTCSGLHIQL